MKPLGIRKTSIYLLPNLITTGCLFAGFYSIIMAVNQQFEGAAIAIFVAGVLDSLDGRVARLTNTTSDFAAHFDSLADVVSFGVAPAVFGYLWLLKDLGKLGWLAVFLFVAATALRLARFNTLPVKTNNGYFYGLPCPAAAMLVITFIWMIIDFEDGWSSFLLGSAVFLDEWLAWILWSIFIFAAFCMVSLLPYYSFKDAKLRKSVPFVALLILAVFIGVISQDPPTILFILFSIYSLSGLVSYILKVRRGNPTGVFEE